MTPLLTACDEGYTEVVQVLLKWKADPNLPAEVHVSHRRPEAAHFS